MQKKNIRIIGLLILLALISGVIFYHKTSEKNRDQSVSSYNEPQFEKNGRLAFVNKNDTIKVIDIEIADDNAERTQGLMWRRSMPDSIGMLFIFENEKPLSFWMKNTYVPLDIIYLNSSMEIVTIRENNAPLNENSIPSDKPAKFVVEVIAGFCYKYKIETGNKINFEIF